MNIWVINANIEKILELYWKGYSFYEALEIVKGGEEHERKLVSTICINCSRKKH